MTKKRILIVEDEIVVAEHVRDTLAGLGYDVPGTVASGKEAAEKAEGLQPDLVLMDIKLKGKMDGVEAAEQIRTRFDIPVVYLTAHADEATLQRAKVSGPFGYVVKPFRPDDLRSTIEMALYKHETDKRLKWEVETNSAIAELSSALLSPASLDDVSYLVLEHAKRLTGSEFGYVGYIDPATGHLIAPTLTRDIWDSCRVEDKDVVFEQFSGLWGWVLDHRQPLLTNTPARDPRSSGTPPGHIPIRRFLSAPALVGSTLVGQVAVANADHDYEERDLALAERLAALYAIAVQRHRAAEALHQRTFELQARNEELDAFAHTVAHDLKGILSHVIGFSELLVQDRTKLSADKLNECLHMVAQGGRQMDNIVDALLLLASVREAEAEIGQLDSAAIVSRALWRLNDLIEEHQATVILPKSWPAAMGYDLWVEEVWVNYISNAVKYGGRPPRVELGATEQEDGSVRFWVRDNGPGLSPEEQTRLFTPFTRLHQVRTEGHGLGLSIVRRIAGKLKGQVGVESPGVPGQGSIFFLTLPGIRGDAAAEAQER